MMNQPGEHTNYCLTCFNQTHGTQFTREQIIPDYDAPCDLCGQRPLVAHAPAWSWRERLRRLHARLENRVWLLRDALEERERAKKENRRR